MALQVIASPPPLTIEAAFVGAFGVSVAWAGPVSDLRGWPRGLGAILVVVVAALVPALVFLAFEVGVNAVTPSFLALGERPRPRLHTQVVEISLPCRASMSLSPCFGIGGRSRRPAGWLKSIGLPPTRRPSLAC